MKVTKHITAFQLANRLCRFIPELEPGAVLNCLEQLGGRFFDPSSFHDWVRYFDGLVIDEKESVPCVKTS